MSATCRTWSGSATSQTTNVASPPWALISATRLISPGSLRAATTSLAPRAASSSADSRPMPLDAPTTTTTWSLIGFSFMCPPAVVMAGRVPAVPPAQPWAGRTTPAREGQQASGFAQPEGQHPRARLGLVRNQAGVLQRSPFRVVDDLNQEWRELVERGAGALPPWATPHGARTGCSG